MCVIWTTLACASHCFSSLFDYQPDAKAANSKQKASSVKEMLRKHVSPHFLLMTVIILISSHSYLQAAAGLTRVQHSALHI